jgi:putative Mg2+ transporter-C (MgtC) family protein
MNLIEILLKLVLAVALGGLVGLERQTSNKPAGIKTNILICVGAAMMMILSGLILGENGERGTDLTRIAAGVITGIGFIGAGTIIQARGIVVGLTTAATIWAVAVLGLVIGTGYYMVAVIFTAIIILTLIIFRYIEEHYLKRSMFLYHLQAKYSKDLLINIKKLAIHEGFKFDELRLKKEGQSAIVDLSFHTTEEKEHRFNQGLLNLAEVLEIKIE